MLEERYELRTRIGQGGLGTVYRGYDSKMKREVAIKRISKGNPDSLPKDAHEQLLKEASTLSSLQHPNVVTVYDFETDDDGPCVVMELISGRVLNEIIDRASLTWHDFRELTMQSQEALIAAQELELVHGDLKPGNIMLDWLPSGKFQVKVVDFGQAVFTKAHSADSVEELETVFGTVHFMPPEQFAKAPLDKRSDMYSIGCVYYQALTSRFPFNGRTGREVTKAHIDHSVVPLHDLRKDIPRWACDWVMWHISRKPEERPQSAREALARFLNEEQVEGDKSDAPSAPKAKPKPASPEASGDKPKKPPVMAIPAKEDPPDSPKASTTKATYYKDKQLVLPKREEEKESPAPKAKETEKPSGRPPLELPKKKEIPKKPQEPKEKLPELKDPTPKKEQPETKEETSSTKVEARGIKFSSPQPLLPPSGSKPSIHPTSSAPAQAPPTGTLAPQPPPTMALTQTAAQAPITAAHQVTAAHATAGHSVAITTSHTVMGRKKGVSNAIKAMIATAMTIAIAILSWVIIDRMEQNKLEEKLDLLISDAARASATELPVTREDLDLLLASAADVGRNDRRAAIYKALLLAMPTDGTNIDDVITEFATSREMLPDVKQTLIRDVLRMRKNPAIVPDLLEYASITPDAKSAADALQAVRFLADDDYFEPIIGIFLGSSDPTVRKAAEDTAAVIIEKSRKKKRLGDLVAVEYASAITNEVRNALLRLLGACGGEKALLTVRGIFASNDNQQTVAALSALGAWGDESGFPVLMEFISNSRDPNLRTRAFDAAYRYLRNHAGSSASTEQWKQLSNLTRTREEQMKMLQNIANLEAEWALNTVRTYAKSDDERVAKKAASALDYMLERQKLNE